MRYFNYPIELELPLFAGIQYQKKCSWISIISVVLPGFFIGYCYRVDKNKGGYIYTVFKHNLCIDNVIGWIIYWGSDMVEYSISESSLMALVDIHLPSIIRGSSLMGQEKG